MKRAKQRKYRLTFSEAMRRVWTKLRPKIVANITANNALLRRLKEGAK